MVIKASLFRRGCFGLLQTLNFNIGDSRTVVGKKISARAQAKPKKDEHKIRNQLVKYLKKIDPRLQRNNFIAGHNVCELIDLFNNIYALMHFQTDEMCQGSPLRSNKIINFNDDEKQDFEASVALLEAGFKPASKTFNFYKDVELIGKDCTASGLVRAQVENGYSKQLEILLDQARHQNILTPVAAQISILENEIQRRPRNSALFAAKMRVLGLPKLEG